MTPVAKSPVSESGYAKGRVSVAAALPGLRADLSFPGGVPAKPSLRYRKSDGTFSGSFKVYVDDGRRVKPVVVRVRGVVLDGVGYGSAYVKKVGDWEATIE